MPSPSFTKRHYRIIAAAIHAAFTNEFVPNAARVWAAGAAADALEGTNPLFDRVRFIAACLDGCDTARARSKRRNQI